MKIKSLLIVASMVNNLYSQNTQDTTNSKLLSIVSTAYNEELSLTPSINDPFEKTLLFQTNNVQDSTTKNKLPKITLVYEYTLDTHGKENRRVAYFYIDNDIYKQKKVGLVCKNLLPYIEKDTTAMKCYSKYKKRDIISSCMLGLSGVAIITSAVGFFAESDETAASAAIVALPAMIAFLTFNTSARKQIEKTVKTYNKNAGYGFIDGLEKKTNTK